MNLSMSKLITHFTVKTISLTAWVKKKLKIMPRKKASTILYIPTKKF